MSLFHLTKQLILKPKEERRIVAGHPWAFSNEIREAKGNPGIGDVAELLTAGGLSLGMGLYNPHSLIAFRLLSPQIEEVDIEFFHKRIARALELRHALYPGQETFRLVHGEGDFLPGLIVDKYGDYIALQTFSFGMDARLPLICDVLESLLHPKAIVERNESSLRLLEHLPQKKGPLRGTVAPTLISEHGLRYNVDVLEGQKTGFFLDQRENRAAIRQFSKGAHVLDCFCNDGGFALNAARAGASSVVGIDVSGEAVERSKKNAALNRLPEAHFATADAFETLQELQSAQEKFDIIVLDPPSFTKSKKNVQTARKGYKELHAGALRLMREGGMLLTSCCSHHIEADVFLTLIDETARKEGKVLQLLDWRGAAPDHPTLPAVPETRYLKFGIFRVL